METIRYDRQIAVKEGLRTSSEINKGYVKRPILKMLKKNICTIDINGYKEYAHDNLKKNILMVPSNLGGYIISFKSYIKADKNKEKLYRKWSEKKSFISIKNLLELESFNNKVITVYVEKQHKNIYTVRNLAGSMPLVGEINLGKFYDIAGKLVAINLSKKNGVYKVNQILEAIEDNTN